MNATERAWEELLKAIPGCAPESLPRRRGTRGPTKCERQMESAQRRTQYKQIPGLPWGDPSSHARLQLLRSFNKNGKHSMMGKPSHVSVNFKPRWNKNARSSTMRKASRSLDSSLYMSPHGL